MSRINWALLWVALSLITTLSTNILAAGGTPAVPISTAALPRGFATHSLHSDLRIASLQSNVVSIPSLRGVNYYPSLNGWYYMWTNWDATTVNNDFIRISSVLHANYVRIIVPADRNFGYPIPRASMLNELSQIITLANNHGLKVDLTLFDLFSNYTDTTGSKQWLSAVLFPYQNDPRIAFIDVQNELDNQNATAVAWAKTMIPYTHSLGGNIPVTVSVSGGIPNLTLQVSKGVPVDFYKLHYYMDASVSYSLFQQALSIVGTSKPLLIGEVGYSTMTTNTFLGDLSRTQASQEAEQDQYIRTVEYAARQLGLPFASPWNYTDFANNANVLTGYLGTNEQYYGLYRTDGTLKPAGATIGSIFSGNLIDVSFNNSFENCDTVNLPTLWRVYQKASLSFTGTFACDSAIVHTGSKSVRISNSRASRLGEPGFYLNPTQYIVANQSYTAMVWAKGANVTGNPHVSLSWFDINHRYLGKDISADLPKGNTNWTQLSVTATAPINAVSVEVHLEVAGTNTGVVWYDDVTFQLANKVPSYLLPKSSRKL